MSGMRRLSLLACLFATIPSSQPAGAVPPPSAPVCTPGVFEGARYVLCRFDPDRHRLDLVFGDGGGRLAPVAYAVARAGPRDVAFAVNAGMWRTVPDVAPVGLFLADGRQGAPLETADGTGNFYLKPNGVFFLDGGRPRVATAEAFADERPSADLATQSGPMLVVDGSIHPRIELPDGSSRKIRNAVGVTDEGEALFVLARARVSFGWLARLYRDELGCADALYLDGEVSRLHAPNLGLTDAVMPLGPILIARWRSGP
jgi:uncharacterized protein YigE (DUF2233 family)